MTTADLAPLGSQQASQHPRAGKGELQMQTVETPHDRKVGFRHRAWQIVDAATADVPGRNSTYRSVQISETSSVSPGCESAVCAKAPALHSSALIAAIAV